MGRNGDSDRVGARLTLVEGRDEVDETPTRREKNLLGGPVAPGVGISDATLPESGRRGVCGGGCGGAVSVVAPRGKVLQESVGDRFAKAASEEIVWRLLPAIASNAGCTVVVGREALLMLGVNDIPGGPDIGRGRGSGAEENPLCSE